jgi:hypothetical protein
MTKKETLVPPPHEPGVLPGFMIEVPASLLPVEWGKNRYIVKYFFLDNNIWF